MTRSLFPGYMSLLLLVFLLLFSGRASTFGENGQTTLSVITPLNRVHQSKTVVEEGSWGGPGIRMRVTKQGAEIEYDCAHGTISEPIRLDEDGRFSVKGTHLRSRPGPVRLGKSQSTPEAAAYNGTVKDQTMTLEVVLTAKSENIGSFTLARGREGRLRKCL